RFEAENWRLKVIEKLDAVDWKTIQKEVELLIEDREELRLFTKENLRLLLEKP
ncbi:MAG: hypothetical protein GY950_00050, partial [bacterium]|nr:hypothetical protein [bacterium]